MPNADTSTASFLGIDPSLRSTGIGVLHGSECHTALHKPPKDYATGIKRLAWHFDQLCEVLTRYHPIFAAIEGASLGSTGLHEEIGQLRGVLLLALHQANVGFIVVPPTSLKKYGARTGSASKEKMIKTATEYWPGIPFTDDTADAAWLAHLAKAFKSPMHHITRPQMEVLHNLRRKNNGSHPRRIRRHLSKPRRSQHPQHRNHRS